MGARKVRIPAPLDEHLPAGGRATAAVLVLRGAVAAVPELPPDPLEVVHLEHEERDDPEQNLCTRHAAHGTADLAHRQWAGRPKWAGPWSQTLAASTSGACRGVPRLRRKG